MILIEINLKLYIDLLIYFLKLLLIKRVIFVISLSQPHKCSKHVLINRHNTKLDTDNNLLFKNNNGIQKLLLYNYFQSTTREIKRLVFRITHVCLYLCQSYFNSIHSSILFQTFYILIHSNKSLF